jgi:hypothetical protein
LPIALKEREIENTLTKAKKRKKKKIQNPQLPSPFPPSPKRKTLSWVHVGSPHLLPTISMLTFIMHQMVNECFMMCHMSSS